jgi:Tfp pilus assembly protein PilF
MTDADGCSLVSFIALEQAPRDSRRCRIYSENGDLVQAEGAILKAIELEKDSAYGWFSLGLLMQKVPGRTADAEEALRRAISCSEPYPCAVPKELATLLIHKGDDKEAASVLQKSLNANKDCHCGILLLAGIASRNGDIESAKAYFERALEVNPESVEAMAGLAQLAIEQGGDLETAQQFVNRASATAPNDPCVLLASARLKRERHSEAACLDDLRNAVAEAPRFLEAKLLLASVEVGMGNVEAALAYVAEVLPELTARRELLPGVVDAIVMLAKQGCAQAVLEIIHQAGVGEYLEPLSVALQLAIGEKPRVAKEVLEVASDIFARMA